MFRPLSLLALAVSLTLGGPSFADEGKDESGKGKHRSESRKHDAEGSSYFRQHRNARIPNGHLPPPGECRVWYPNRPAGQQPPPFKCDRAPAQVEPGGWYMSPGPVAHEVEVAVYDQRRPGVVIDVGIFDARTGSMIRIVGAK